MRRDQAFYTLALSLVPGLGRSRLDNLIREFERPSAVFELTRSQLRRLRFSFEVQASIASGCAAEEAERVLKAAAAQGVTIISRFDEAYPPLLKEIHEPPAVLYCKGDMSALRQPAVAIVGSRRCSVYGREVTRKLARDLGSAGLCIVSGLARGVDSMAHLGCLEAGAVTLAVLGTGIDITYPKENRSLYERIARGGCLLSEFPFGQFPAPQNFPIRNRIISGLCYGTLITEASEYSGSLITARLTLEQNRELWAVPGNIVNPGSYGPNYLIKQGARPVLTAQDVIDELPAYILASLSDKIPEAQSHCDPDLTEPEARVFKLLKPDEPLHFDRLLNESGLMVPDLIQILFQLEIKGKVTQAPGRMYCRKLF